MATDQKQVDIWHCSFSIWWSVAFFRTNKKQMQALGKANMLDGELRTVGITTGE